MKPEQRSMDGGLAEGRVADHPGASGLDPGRGQRWAQRRVPGPLRRLCHLCEHVLKVEVSQHVPILQETHIMGGAGLPAPPLSAPPPSARPIREHPGPYPPPRPKPHPRASASSPPDGPAPNRERRPRPRPPRPARRPRSRRQPPSPSWAHRPRRTRAPAGSVPGAPRSGRAGLRPRGPAPPAAARPPRVPPPGGSAARAAAASPCALAAPQPAGHRPRAGRGGAGSDLRHFRCRRGFRCELRRTGARTRGESGRGRWGLSLAGGRRRGSVSLPRAPPPAVRRPLRDAWPAGVSPLDPALGYGAGLCAAPPTVHVPNSNRAASLRWRLPPLLRPHYPHPCPRRVCLPPEGLARPLGRAGLQTRNQTGARVVFAKFTSYGNASLFKALRWLPVTLVQRLSRSLSGPARSACLSSLLPPISS